MPTTHMNPDSTSPPPNSIPSLLRELRDESLTLLRQEVSLAKTELKDNVSRVGRHSAKIAVGGFVAYAGVIVLLIGLGQLLGAGLTRAGVDPDLAQWLAPTLVGLVVALIGWGMVSKAKHALTDDPLAPHQTIASLKENKQW
ncbi:MAG: hypothetical protein RIQ93_3214, partial [Verrucomicrobiota bacterium]